MRDNIYLCIYVFVALVVGYHLRWMQVEFNKYIEYKKPKSILCQDGIAYQQVEPNSTVYTKNKNLQCVEK